MGRCLFLNPDLFSKPQTAKNHHFKTSRDQNAVIVGSFEQIKLLAVTKCCAILMKDKLISTCCWMNGYAINYNKHLPYNLLCISYYTLSMFYYLHIMQWKIIFKTEHQTRNNHKRSAEKNRDWRWNSWDE